MIQESLDEEIWGSQTEREVISNNMGITAASLFCAEREVRYS